MSTDTPLQQATVTLPSDSNTVQTEEGRVWNAAFIDDNLNSTTTTTTDSGISDITNDPSMVDDALPPVINEKLTSPTTSSTAYSFSGSALASESIDINAKIDKDKDGTDTNAKTTSGGGDTKEDDKNEESMFECNICLDTAKDAVVSMCGHLFCWPCLHQWLETRPNRKLCPVCKAAIGKDKVIPLYGRNSTKQEDPRNKVPPRPAGQRTEPEPQQGFQGFSFGDGFHMSFGIGAFPFGYFTSSLNFGEPRPAPANRGTTLYEDEQQLSKLFLYLAFLCIAWLLFA